MLELFREVNERFKKVIAQTHEKCALQRVWLTRQRASLERQRKHLADVRALYKLTGRAAPSPGAGARAGPRPEDSRH